MMNPKIKLSIEKATTKKHNKQRNETPWGKQDTYHKTEAESYRPHRSMFKKWLETTINYVIQHPKYGKKINPRDNYEVYLRLVEEKEMKKLAAKYKHSGDTVSVLSFPSEVPLDLGQPDLGDIVMCGKSIFREAAEMHIEHKVHWEHLFIHSILHLMGWEHGDEMENLENEIIKECDLPSPRN